MKSRPRLDRPASRPGRPILTVFVCALVLPACIDALDDSTPDAADEGSASNGSDGGREDPDDDASAPVDARVQIPDAATPDDGEVLDPGDARLPTDAAPPDAGVGSAGSDDVLGTPIARAGAWWVDGATLNLGDQTVRLFGVNWSGLETTARALYGVQESQRSVADFLAQIKGLGFNALRVPLSPESIEPGFLSEEWARRGSIDTGREQFEELAQAAKNAGIYMLWDIHTCASSVGYRKLGPTDPQCMGYGKAGWLADLKTLAALAKTYEPYVVGIDLFNEPYGLGWPDWKALAEEGGRAVLAENPRILTFVEGVGAEGYAGPEAVYWGENLTYAATQPVDLPASRLVFSPHVYGPSVYVQPYFGDADYPANMPAIWDKHFGYLFAGRAVVPGEFGGRYLDADKIWQDAFVGYLAQRAAPGFFYWCLNPNSDDTGGLLREDWRTVNTDKLTLLERLLR